MKAKTIVCSSVGVKRKINQDNFYINGVVNKRMSNRYLRSFPWSSAERVVAVCDGMGGEKRGEQAALLAVENLKSYAEKYSRLFDRFEEHVRVYARKANNAICSMIQQNNGERSGSTLALLCISLEQERAVAANMGDTKIYYCNGGNLAKLSEDHNQAQRLVSLGVITEEEARIHPDKAKLTQHFGIFESEMLLEPYVSNQVMLKKGDVFLICSDGLTDMLNLQQISEILCGKGSLRRKCCTLVHRANEYGGKDNVTAVLIAIK